MSARRRRCVAASGIAWLAGATLLASCGPGSAPAPAGPPPAAATESAHDGIHFGIREAPARTPGTLRLATYNLLNLFDDHDDPTLSGRYEDIDDAKPESERLALAAAIRAIDADILALQEVESESALREFRDGYLAGLGYDHLVSIDTGDPRGIECAVLSRFPITGFWTWGGLELGGVHPEMWGGNPNDWAGEPIAFKRSPLRVDVAVPASDDGSVYTLTLFVLHNKAGGPGAYWREAESRKIVELVAEAAAERPEPNIIVLGDLNAMSTDPSVRILLDTGLLEVLPFDPSRPLETVSHESGRRIDHILVNAWAMREVVPESGFIFGTPSRAPGANWRTTPAPPGMASDHFPVVVDLWIGDR